jgi:Phage integrase family
MTLIHPHVLRHVANDGHDTQALQHYLGHKNIQHTVRYTEMARPLQRFLERLLRLSLAAFTRTDRRVRMLKQSIAALAIEPNRSDDYCQDQGSTGSNGG